MDKDEVPAGIPQEPQRGEPAEEVCHADGRIEHPALRFERSDVHLGCVLWLIVVAACVLGTLSYGVWRFFWQEAGSQQAAKTSPYPAAPNLPANLPPQPRLEQLDRTTPQERKQLDLMTADESAAVNQQLAIQEKALHRYGQAAEKGFLQIPIEQAIKTLAGTLPVSKEPPPGRDASGLLDSGQSNSGRMFRGPLP